MAELPDAQREALSLAYFDGLSHTESPSGCGCPIGTVKGRIRLALDRLRTLSHRSTPSARRRTRERQHRDLAAAAALGSSTPEARHS